MERDGCDSNSPRMEKRRRRPSREHESSEHAQGLSLSDGDEDLVQYVWWRQMKKQVKILRGKLEEKDGIGKGAELRRRLLQRLMVLSHPCIFGMISRLMAAGRCPIVVFSYGDKVVRHPEFFGDRFHASKLTESIHVSRRI